MLIKINLTVQFMIAEDLAAQTVKSLRDHGNRVAEAAGGAGT
jgi:hypothetical protein